jgi:alpha-amylase
MGGDIQGITAQIKEGYFTDLGVNAIWFTPVVEQITGSVDEGTGNSFGFHGYGTRDWTALDPKFGTKADLAELVSVAHDHEIRILIDVVANHTGPVTPLDVLWPDTWVKTGPQCTYKSSETTINCTLVKNLPDIRTEIDEEVELPQFLIDKWKAGGRYEAEVLELKEWFETTGYKKTAVNYILKWLVDFIKEFGIDGFRVDTVKHTDSKVWSDLWAAAFEAHEKYKKEFPEKVIDDTELYMVGEVYNYFISGGREFNYGDTKVDFFKNEFKSLINFYFKYDADKDYESTFVKYDQLLNGPLAGKSVLNYISSHDDGTPFDKERKRAIEAGTKLLLTPGGVQIYYGDETARDINVIADGDAKLRSFMNWDELSANKSKGSYTVQEILEHWQRLGNFCTWKRSATIVAEGKLRFAINSMVGAKSMVISST